MLRTTCLFSALASAALIATGCTSTSRALGLEKSAPNELFWQNGQVLDAQGNPAPLDAELEARRLESINSATGGGQVTISKKPPCQRYQRAGSRRGLAVDWLGRAADLDLSN